RRRGTSVTNQGVGILSGLISAQESHSGIDRAPCYRYGTSEGAAARAVSSVSDLREATDTSTDRPIHEDAARGRNGDSPRLAARDAPPSHSDHGKSVASVAIAHGEARGLGSDFHQIRRRTDRSRERHAAMA